MEDEEIEEMIEEVDKIREVDDNTEEALVVEEVTELLTLCS